MYKHISNDSIASVISTVKFFPPAYFEEYVKNFTRNGESENMDERQTPLIFITKVEYLDNFYDTVVTSLDRKFVLITHYGDMQSGLHQRILQHPLLLKWYGQNMCLLSDKTMPIPIGLESKYWGRTNTSTIDKHYRNPKNELLYLNFSLGTNPDRPRIMNSLLDKGFKQNEALEWERYIEDLSKHKFCISPKGNGVDCHRTWECLYLGVIPIVEKSPHMAYFDDLPILFVENYDSITIEYLNRMYDLFKSRSFNMDKLDISYWNREIRGCFE